MATLSNFIPINRKLFKHEFWLEKRPYSKFEAWLDIITTARFDNTEGRMVIGCTVVRWGRGEMPASIRFLTTRWGWSKTKVENFLRLLRHEDMITTRTADGTAQTIITICNYDSYNTTKADNKTAEGQHEDTTETVERQHEDKTNKENKEQIIKEREIYRSFAHLVLYHHQFLNLLEAGHTKTQIDTILDEIENYKNNKKYTSLYLTAKKWLTKNEVAAPGRIVNIASAFTQALKHGS